MSKAQLRQDIFALSEHGFKSGGFFVEFGATNGVELSNTYLLETHFGWKGILAEPAKIWQGDLIKNRQATIDFDCVWTTTGEELTFNQARSATLSTIREFSGKDFHAERRRDGDIYTVRTVSLIDLLKRHGAPHVVDYLSIDTEGSELEILSHFDFEAYDVRVITCEHNHTPDRAEIFSLLSGKGFARKYDSISKFDDWYVKLPR